MPTVLDYSQGFPGADAIASRGYIGAVRYIGFPDRRKCTAAGELADFNRRGLGMALVYEDFDGDWLNGFGGGQAAAQRARNHANAIGFPVNRPIYMAVDRDVATEAQFRSMSQYLAGANSVLGYNLTGVYGEHDVCLRAANDRVATWFWQCRAWSGTPVRLFAGRHLYQQVGTVDVNGIGCDINDVLRADWGQHNAPVHAVISGNNNDEDYAMLVPAGTNEHIFLPTAGKPQFWYIGSGYGHHVYVHQVDYVNATTEADRFVPGAGFNSGSDDGTNNAVAWDFVPDKPGPVTIPANPNGHQPAGVSIRYTADYPFTLSCN